MTHGPSPTGVSFVAREAERMAQNSDGKRAMLLNHIALGCMVAMALPCVLQSFSAVFRGVEGLSHVQRVNHERVGRRLHDREMERDEF